MSTAQANANASDATTQTQVFSSTIIAFAIGIGEPIILALGIPGNIAIIVVISKLKSGVGQSVSVYYLGIAVSELVMLLSLGLVTFLFAFLPFYGVPAIILAHMGEWACRADRFPYWAFGSVTAFLYAALSLERLVAITFPLKARYLLTQSNAAIVVGGIYAFWITFWILIFAFASRYSPTPTGWECNPGAFDSDRAIPFLTAYVMLDYLIPTALSTLFSSALLVQTARVSAKRQRITASANKDDLSANIMADLRRSAVVLITCGIHTCYYWPLAVTFVVAFATWYEPVVDVNQILHGLSGITYSMNFFVYFVKIREFRRFVTSKCSR